MQAPLVDDQVAFLKLSRKPDHFCQDEIPLSCAECNGLFIPVLPEFVLQFQIVQCAFSELTAQAEVVLFELLIAFDRLQRMHQGKKDGAAKETGLGNARFLATQKHSQG